MQIKSVIIDNIHYIIYIMFNISTLFHYFLAWIYNAEIGVRLIHQCVSYVIKYGMFWKSTIFYELL